MPTARKVILAINGAPTMSTMLTLQDVASARQFYDRGHWRSDTLYGLLRASAERTPDRFALRDTNSRLTFRSALQWVDAVAQDLHDAGVRPGERVSIWLPSRLETALVFIACSRMGYVLQHIAAPRLHLQRDCRACSNARAPSHSSPNPATGQMQRRTTSSPCSVRCRG